MTTYPVPATDSTEAREVTIHHRGYTNVRAVLDWAFGSFLDPETVFVTGSSAGAFPSVFYFPDIVEHWEDATVTQLADAAGGYRHMPFSRIKNSWGTPSAVPDFRKYAAFGPSDTLLEDYLIATAWRYPDRVLAQYNTSVDYVQVRFLSLGGVTGIPLIDLLDANYADIRSSVSNFRAFTAGGTSHTILMRPEFYNLRTGGVRIRDWVAMLAAGEAVEDVRCTACEDPGFDDVAD